MCVFNGKLNLATIFYGQGMFLIVVNSHIMSLGHFILIFKGNMFRNIFINLKNNYCHQFLVESVIFKKLIKYF